jgi:hypothetical protein
MRRALVVIALFVLATVCMSASNAYGYFIDELYYLACSKRLAFGYVDHPPLSIAILALVTKVVGTSKLAIRIPALACVAGSIFTSAVLARRFGGGGFASALAALAAATSPIALILGSFYSMNAIELLLWPLASLAFLEAIRGNDRAWLVLGAIFGLGLENKHTMVVLALAFACGVVATSARARLRTQWLWLGVALAVALVIPNLVWQHANGWPSFEFYRNAQSLKNIPTGPVKAIANQILVAGPGAIAVWIAGAVWLLRDQRFRSLGVAFVVLFAMMIASGSSRPDRIAPFYSTLFAAGGVVLERAVTRPWLRALACVPPFVLGALLAPVTIPVLDPARTAAYTKTLGLFPKTEKGKTSPIPQPLADRTGWPELARDVESVVGSLSPEERSHARILCTSYGVAGALEELGHDLPPVIATHDSYWLWGPGDGTPDVIVAIGFSDHLLAEVYADRRDALVHRCTYCMSWRDDMPIVIAREPHGALASIWPRAKHFE